MDLRDINDTRLRRELNRVSRNLFSNPGYTPRTRVARELSELLIGQDSIASDRVLVENRIDGFVYCDQTEDFQWAILSRRGQVDGRKTGEFYRRGVWVIFDGEPVGYIACKQEKVLVAARAVQRNDGTYSLLRYAVCGLPEQVRPQIPIVSPGEWGLLSLEELRVAFGRFLDYRNVSGEDEQSQGVNFERAIAREMRYVAQQLNR
jgi:hypothetical protein